MVQNNKSSCLIIFAREPEEGRVKTRLLNALPVSVVTDLYKAFVEDVLNLAKKVRCQKRMIYYTASNSTLPFLSAFKKDFILRKQKGKNLGERMYTALKESRKVGFERIVIIGTDCLTLTTDDINRAFQKLQAFDCVLGPSQDGGYYLIGLNDSIKDLFYHVPWSTADVLRLTLERINQLKKRVFLLEKREDIDTIGNLQRLIQVKNISPLMRNTNTLIKKIPQLQS